MNEGESILRQAISGSLKIQEAFRRIKAVDGFPIDTGRGSFLFAIHSSKENWMLAYT